MILLTLLEQLARLKIDKLSVGQRHEVDRLTEQVGLMPECHFASILSLAEQLKEGTIVFRTAKSRGLSRMFL